MRHNTSNPSGREKDDLEFDREIVIEAYLSTISSVALLQKEETAVAGG